MLDVYVSASTGSCCGHLRRDGKGLWVGKQMEGLGSVITMCMQIRISEPFVDGLDNVGF